MKMRKIHDWSTCLCAFQNWTKCQKRLKSTELDKSVIIKQNLSERKTKGAILSKPTLLVSFKVCNVSLAYTLNK